MNPALIKQRDPHVRRPLGFTLVEMALVVGLIGLLAYLFLPLGNTLREEQQRKDARAKLEAIDAALIRFVMLNDRLPCPADGALPDTDTNYGFERNAGTVTGCVNGVENRGVVPWRTLGLPMDAAIDPWGNWVTYRPYVNGNRSLTGGGSTCSVPSNNNYDFSSSLESKKPMPQISTDKNWKDFLDKCTSAFPPNRRIGWTIDSVTSAATCTALVANPQATPHTTGAAYILISHGANRCGAYTPQGVYVNTCTGTAGMGVAEDINRNNNPPLTGNPTTPGQCYKDGPYQEKASAQPFDDIVLWRTVMQVAVEAKKLQ